MPSKPLFNYSKPALVTLEVILIVLNSALRKDIFSPVGVLKFCPKILILKEKALALFIVGQVCE